MSRSSFGASASCTRKILSAGIDVIEPDGKRRRQRVKTVENDADRRMVGAPHDLPGVAVVVDMPAPGQRLESDAQAAARGQLAEFAKIVGGAVDAAERNWRYVAADQQQIGPKLLHQVELALGSRKSCGLAAAPACPRNREMAGTRRFRDRDRGRVVLLRADLRRTTTSRSRKSRPRQIRPRQWHAISRQARR